MARLVWGIALLAVICLLQVPVAYWLGRYFKYDGSGVQEPGADLPVEVEEYDRTPGVCPRCGAQNDPEFDYCANCVSPLRRVPNR